MLSQETLISNFDISMIYQISSLPSWISQSSCKNAHKAVERYKFQDVTGKKFGKPRYKTEKIKTNSFAYSTHINQTYIKQYGNKIVISVPGIGKISGSGDTRKIEGNVKQISIKCDTCRNYWATIVTDNVRKNNIKRSNNRCYWCRFRLKTYNKRF